MASGPGSVRPARGRVGAKVLVQAANGNDALQNSQAENMLTQGVDVLLVAPHNGKTAAVIVEAAHARTSPSSRTTA